MSYLSDIASIKDFIENVSDVCKKNYVFLKRELPKLLREVMALISDIENTSSNMIEIYQKRKDILEYSMMYPAILFVLKPQAVSIFTSLLLGDISSPYCSIRAMLEALVGACLLDVKYGTNMRVLEKTETTDFRFSNPCVLVTSLADALQDSTLASEICGFWETISSFGLHALSRLPDLSWWLEHKDEEKPPSILARILISLERRKHPLPYALIMPIEYIEEDLEELEELLEYISGLRKLLRRIINKWQVLFVEKYFKEKA